jgi:FkbM family methyltransferase
MQGGGIVIFLYRDKAVTLEGLVGDHIYDSICKRQTFYEDRMLDFILKTIPHFDTIVDVGANIGNHTVFFGLFTDAAHILAIEPNPQALPFLYRNISRNGLSNMVSVFPKAVGAEDRFVGLTLGDPHNLGSTGITEDGHTILMTTVDTITMDIPVTLLKIDVEGYEMNVLAGATKVLSQHPHIFIEAQTAEQKVDIDTFLRPFGYPPSTTQFNWTPTFAYY